MFNIPMHSHSWQSYQLPHIIFLVIWVIFILSLYLFPKLLLKDALNKKIFLWVLFGIQLIAFILYRSSFFYGAITGWKTASDENRVKSIISLFPLDYCQITQLLSLLIIIIPKNKFFSIVCIYPIVASALAIIFPTDGPKAGSYDDLYYYEYFISHMISMAVPIYMFKYGIRKFEKNMFKWSIIWLCFVSFFVLVINIQFGLDNMELIPTLRVGFIDFTKFHFVSDPKVNIQVGGLFNFFFVIFVMGIFGNYLGWAFYRYQKPYVDYKTKKIINKPLFMKIFGKKTVEKPKLIIQNK